MLCWQGCCLALSPRRSSKPGDYWYHARSPALSTLWAIFVCPQPAQGPALYDGQIMAICMRCYGTVLGLLLTRLLYAADAGAGRGWLRRYGLRALPIFAALIFTYAAEFAGQAAGLWGFNNLVVTAAGLITGAGLGSMFHPILQGQAATTHGHE